MSHSNSGVWGHSSAIGANMYIIFAVSDDIAVNKAFMGYCAGKGISIKPLLGSYKGKTEQSYIANYKALGALLNSGWLKGQESILVLGACNARDQRPASLHYLTRAGDDLKPLADDLGLFQSVSRGEALAQEAWTYDPDLKEYFICIDPGAVKVCPIGLNAAITLHCAQHDRPLGDNQDTRELITAYLLARRII